MGTDFLVDANNVGAEGKTLANLLNPKIHSITETGIFTIENYMYGHMAKIDSSVVTEIELSIYKGTDSDELNWIWVHNDTALVQKVVRNGQEFWLEPGQKVKFFIRGTTLVWGSAGWELVYHDETNTDAVDPSTEGNFPARKVGQKFQIEASYSSGTSFYSGNLIIRSLISGNSLASPVLSGGNARYIYNYSTDTFYNEDTNNDIKVMYLWHNGE